MQATSLALNKGMALAAALVLGLAATRAEAIQFSFSGQVDAVSGSFEGTAFAGAQIGDPFIVDITFDGNTADLLPDAARGVYAQTISAYSVQIGSASDDTLTFNGSINVFNNHAIEDDEFNASGFLADNVAALIVLEDPTEVALSSDALPTVLDLNAFSSRRLLLSVPDGSIGGSIAVPEPGALILLAIALVLGCRRQRRSE